IRQTLDLLWAGYPQETIGHAADAVRRALISHLEAVILQHQATQLPDDVALANVLQCLGDVYGDLGEAGKQRDLLVRALAIQEKHYGRDHRQVAITLTNLANAYGALGELDKQRNLLERALVIDEKHYGRDHWQVASTLVNLSAAYGDLGEAGKQRSLL